MKIVSTKAALTYAVLRPPLTEKEVGENFFNFDLTGLTSLPRVWDFCVQEIIISLILTDKSNKN